MPSGISFSAFSILLDQLIGAEDSAPFSFEIHQFARVWEPSAEAPLHSSYYYSAYDAVHTAVDLLLSTGKTINYLRNGQVYQIRVESVDDQYPFSYPLVLKTPRGTDTYALMMKMQDGFRIEERELKRPKNKEQMLAQTKKGVLRIPKVQKVLAEDSPYYRQSSALMMQNLMHQVRSLMEDINQTMQEYKPHGEKTEEEQYTIREILDFYNRSELEEIAKTHDIALQKKDLKEDVVDRIAAVLLNPDTLNNHFVSLTDAETNAFEEVMNAGGILQISEEKEKDYTALMDTAYVFYSSEDLIIIGTDIMDAYRKISTPEFHARRRKVSYLRQCLITIVPIYYTVLPVRKFTRICRRTADPEIQASEIAELLRLIPVSLHECVIRDDTIYTEQVIQDPDAMSSLQAMQRDKPFYIMKEDEIDEILQYGYPCTKKVYRQFRDYLISELNVAPDLAEKVLKRIHRLIALSYRIQAFFDTLEENDIIPTQKQADEIMKHYMALVADTHTTYNRGFTPNEMKRIGGDGQVMRLGTDDAKIAVRD